MTPVVTESLSAAGAAGGGGSSMLLFGFMLLLIIGIDHFLDAKDLHSREVETDDFYYNAASDLIGREKSGGPMFVLSYLMANHFPWDLRWRPDLATDWRDLGNVSVEGHRVDEYLRRQEMSARAYKGFVERLKRDFPNEPFLIVRFGDHQPLFAKRIIDPTLDNVGIGRRIDANDPRYFTTYYAIEPLNFKPADLSSAITGLDAADIEAYNHAERELANYQPMRKIKY